MVQNLKPLVIRINDVGRAEAVNYESFEHKPQDAEIRYFLMQFVTRHYGRRRAAVREDYASSLYFLDGKLAGSINLPFCLLPRACGLILLRR
jgi:type IV secretion system protein VirB5